MSAMVSESFYPMQQLDSPSDDFSLLMSLFSSSGPSARPPPCLPLCR